MDTEELTSAAPLEESAPAESETASTSTPQVTTAPEPKADATPKAETTEPPATPDLDSILKSVDPKVLRSHPTIAGIVGSELQTRQQRWQAEQDAREAREREEQQREAVRGERQRLRLLMKTDPQAYLDEMEQRETQAERDEAVVETRRQQDALRGQTTSTLARQIGARLQADPEWQEIAQLPATLAALSEAVAGLSDDAEVIAAFTAKVTDLRAQHRSAKQQAAWVATQRVKETEAARTEAAAKQLATSDAPDLRKPAAAARPFDPTKLSDREFNKYWDRRVLKK